MIKWDEITVGFWALNIEHETELKGTCPGTDISLITSSTCEKSCCHIWSQHDKPFPRYHIKQFQW